MKKKSMMLGGLLAAVVVTAYSVSGTYAKYISSVDLTDEARVAKWELNFNGKEMTGTQTMDLFSNSYSIDKDPTTNADVYVKSLDTDNDGVIDKVVAPGTKGDYEFTLTGTMETRYKLSFQVPETANDFVVYYTISDAGEITKMETTPFNGAEEYHPLRYVVTYPYTDENGQPATKDSEELDINGLKKLLNEFSQKEVNGEKVDRTFKPGDINKTFKISWKWAPINKFTGLNDDATNVLDTFAGKNLSDNLVKFDVKVTAEQVTDENVDADRAQ